MTTGATAGFELIHYEVAQGRARITLTRPKAHNAFTSQMLDELERACWEADDDPEVHCVILKGDGPSFCAGYDLAALPGHGRGPKRRGGRSHDDDIWHIERTNRQIWALWEMHKPSIAQVHGYCLAGGTGLALEFEIQHVAVARDARRGERRRVVERLAAHALLEREGLHGGGDRVLALDARLDLADGRRAGDVG